MLDPNIISAHTEYLGVKHHARGDVIETPLTGELEIVRAADGRTVKVEANLGWEVTVPVLNPFADLLPLFALLQTFTYGRRIGPTPIPVSGIVAATDVVTTEAAHHLATADAVYPSWDEVSPASAPALARGTAVYWRTATSTTGSLHDTSGHATANTDKLNFSADWPANGSGTLWLLREFPLVVFRRTGVKRTYRNAIVTEYPKLMFKGGAWFFEGNLKFACLPAIGTAPTGDAANDAACFYAETNAAYVKPTWAGNDVLTQPPVSIVWGASAPWDDFQSAEGIVATIAPKFQPFHDGAWPLAGMLLQGCDVSVEGQPAAITKPEFDAAQRFALGAIKDGEDLVITSADAVLTLKQSVMRKAPTNYSAANLLVPKITWDALGEGAGDFRVPFTLAAAA